MCRSISPATWKPEAKFYAITKAGEKALTEETQRWQRMTGLMEKLLSEGAAL
jgi:DNA-binding PadR family transcriptional regulator